MRDKEIIAALRAEIVELRKRAEKADKFAEEINVITNPLFSYRCVCDGGTCRGWEKARDMAAKALTAYDAEGGNA